MPPPPKWCLFAFLHLNLSVSVYYYYHSFLGPGRGGGRSRDFVAAVIANWIRLITSIVCRLLKLPCEIVISPFLQKFTVQWHCYVFVSPKFKWTLGKHNWKCQSTCGAAAPVCRERGDQLPKFKHCFAWTWISMGWFLAWFPAIYVYSILNDFVYCNSHHINGACWIYSGIKYTWTRDILGKLGLNRKRFNNKL